MFDSSGFYRLIGSDLQYAPNRVIANGYVLARENRDAVQSLPDGWRWFDSEDQARLFFEVPMEFIDSAPEGITSLTKEQKIRSVQLSVKLFIDSQIDAAGWRLIGKLSDMGSAKAQAIENWVSGVYKESYMRQALIEAELWDDSINPYDFKSFGEKPYTMIQLQMEAGL